jgi:hypothetical protein
VTQRCIELGVAESRPEMSHGLPHRVVQKHSAAGNPLMKLRGNKSGLAFHPFSVFRLRFQQRRDIRLGDTKEVDQNNRRLVGLNLFEDRYVSIQGLNLQHGEISFSM